MYGKGTSEEYLGKIGWQKRGLVMETKLYPWPVRPSSQRLPYGQGAYTEHSVLIQHPCFLTGLYLPHAGRAHAYRSSERARN